MFHPFESTYVTRKMMIECRINIPNSCPLSAVGAGDNHFIVAVNIFFFPSDPNINSLF
ncbi:hypothetical protein HanXRQr2_Chr06g0258231 [Helianthus annuus]|uniref:Uncharacterized protein n=1 Tax=Helianthus annuus TaxID=4232 RepID=A0A9K3ISU4_HELAN|nr:hypothetical protein HanXRQr2_Chr06g0258231 [Helianthus annuus]KAJ0915385.1 hypothetical protein HanPSC8_Chr06g0249261 [Helianthus annuus]